MSKLVSPNDMLDAAKKAYLDGREPETKRDWQLVINFVAFNSADGLEDTISRLFLKIYDIPLSDAEASEIAAYQCAQKAIEKAKKGASRK